MCLDETVALTRLAARLLIGFISSVACLGRKKKEKEKETGPEEADEMKERAEVDRM